MENKTLLSVILPDHKAITHIWVTRDESPETSNLYSNSFLIKLLQNTTKGMMAKALERQTPRSISLKNFSHALEPEQQDKDGDSNRFFS